MKNFFIIAVMVLACYGLSAKEQYQSIKKIINPEFTVAMGKSCMAAVCELPQNWCSDQNNIKTISGWCTKSDGECVETICKKNPNTCDSSDELKNIILACSSGGSGSCDEQQHKSCIAVGCEANPYNCQNHLDYITKDCKGANGQCVAAGCNANPYNCKNHLDYITQYCQANVDADCVEAACAANPYDCQSHFDRIAQQCTNVKVQKVWIKE